MRTGHHTIDGRGRPSEDRFFIEELPGDFIVAGVFDGHSGSSVVDITIKQFPQRLIELVKAVGNNEQKLRKGLSELFIQHDKLLAKQGALIYRDSGSTATVAIITPTHCYIAFVGDSPAFIFNPDNGALITAIGKHEPTRPDEYKRVIQNGGTVTTEEGDAPRVNDCLMVSRAFGDFSMKFKNSRIPEWDKNWVTDFCVVADPEIVVVPRPARGCIAISSDGLVDKPDGTFRSPTDLSMEIFKTGLGDLMQTAQQTVNKQILNFTDNPKEYDADDITLVLVDFSKAQEGGKGKTPFTRKSKKRRRGLTKRGELLKTFLI